MNSPTTNSKDPIPTVRGEVSILRVLDASGKEVDHGLVVEGVSGKGETKLGDNLVVNLGRQAIAKLLGGQDLPASDWAITKVSFGTGDFTPRYSDSTLSPQTDGMIIGGTNEIDLGSLVFKKPIDSVDFPGPFLVRFLFSLDYGEANGFVVREAGLWTENETLFARKTFPGIVKSVDHRIELSWALRC